MAHVKVCPEIIETLVFGYAVKTDQWPAWEETLEDLALPTYAFYRLEDEAVNKPTRGLEALAWAEQTGVDPRG